MTTEKRKLIRLAGIAALICAAIMFAADVVMLGLPVSGTEIIDYHAWSKIPEWRLRVGSYGAFVIPVFVVGVWQLYEGIKPAGGRWAIPPFLLLSNFFITGAIYHYLFVFVGAAAATQAQMQSPDYGIMEMLIRKMQDYMRLPYCVVLVSVILGSLWFAAAVLFRPTYFPRWMALLNPALLIGAAFLIIYWLPAPVAGYLLPPVVHFATPVIFGVSTILLWNIQVDLPQKN